MALVPYVLVDGVWTPLTQGAPAPPVLPPPITVGVTVSGQTYGKTSAQSVQAANILDGYLSGDPPVALGKQRWYFEPGVWPSFPNLPAGLADLIAAGCQIQLCVRPGGKPQQLIASERTNLAKTLALMNSAGAVYDVTMWTEMTAPGDFSSAAFWQSWWNYYAPTVKGVAPLCYNPACNLGDYSNGITYFTGSLSSTECWLDPLPDVYYVDWYGNDFRGTVTSGGVDTGKNRCFPDQNPPGLPTNFMALADANGLAFGISEWGNATSNAKVMSQQDWYSYITYITALMTGRQQQGKPCASVLMYATTGVGNSPVTNSIQSATDFKTGNPATAVSGIPAAGLLTLYNTLQLG